MCGYKSSLRVSQTVPLLMTGAAYFFQGDRSDITSTVEVRYSSACEASCHIRADRTAEGECAEIP